MVSAEQRGGFLIDDVVVDFARHRQFLGLLGLDQLSLAHLVDRTRDLGQHVPALVLQADVIGARENVVADQNGRPGVPQRVDGRLAASDVSLVDDVVMDQRGRMDHLDQRRANEKVSAEELAQICEITDSFGRTEVVPERLMDAVSAVSGCSPAYVFMFIEAMADAAVAQGMPRKQAYQFAAQALLGSAKMVLETGMHPGELKDMVCSPAGSTIEGVRILEQNGFRSAVFEALNGAAEKGKKM